MSPDINEKGIRVAEPYQLSLAIARAKADALAPKVSGPAILVTADQVVVCNGALFEKPQSTDEARQFMRAYSDGHPAETVSALVVVDTKSGRRAEGVDIAKIFFNAIPDNVVEDFIKDEDPGSRAGGFSVESARLAPYLRGIEGTVESVKGMPIALLERLVAEVRG